MSTDGFDMGSFPDLEEPSFPDNEADFPLPDSGTSRGSARPPRNFVDRRPEKCYKACSPAIPLLFLS